MSYDFFMDGTCGSLNGCMLAKVNFMRDGFIMMRSGIIAFYRLERVPDFHNVRTYSISIAFAGKFVSTGGDGVMTQGPCV